MTEHECTHPGHKHHTAERGSPEWHAARKEYFEDVEEKLKEHSFLIQGVFSTGGGPSFAYTVGLTRRGLPELIVGDFGMEDMGHLLNYLAEIITAEDFRKGYILPSIAEGKRPLKLREVDPANRDWPLSTAMNVFEGQFEGHVRACQVLLACCHVPGHDFANCDRQGDEHSYPDEHDCTEFTVLEAT